MKKQKTRWRSISMASAILCIGVSTSNAAQYGDDYSWSMGPVGGSFQVQSGQSYIAVRSVEAGSPAELAGLQVGDYITGAYSKSFSATGESTEGYKGAAQGFAQAIERAESSNGQMPLTILRPSVGALELTVNLPAAGAFGAAYPLGSSKFDSIYQTAAGEIHSQVDGSSDGSFGYMTGFYGLVLIADPNWNETTGAKPYRLSIDKLKGRCVNHINAAILAPVEATNLDGTPNDGSVDDSDPNDQSYVSPGLENWDLSVSAMFLAEYRKKTGDTAVDAAVQRAADALTNRIQTWQQPPYSGSNGPTKAGLMGHGGVVGDYPHISYAGMNIISAHAMTALAMLKDAGATVNDTKMQAAWSWVKGSTLLNGGSDDGNIGYGWQQGGYDSGGRTAGVAFAMSSYGGLNSADQETLGRMKDYVTRQWQRMQHTHAYTVGGNQFYQLVLPYLPDRDQRFIMENQRLFYHFHRKMDGSLTYFGGRENNGGDSYVGTHSVALTNVGIAQSVASGNLTTIAPIDSTRIHADFQSPFLTWPTLDARRVEIDSLSQAFTVDVTDYQGSVESAANYTAIWTHISGPATATFTSPNTAGTTVNFPQDGTYRIQLEVVKAGYTLTEPIDVVVDTSTDPAGYVLGQVRQRVYTGIGGTNVTDLTGASKYPDAPDSTGTLSSIDSSSLGDSLGQRINGYIIPPTTGDYTFYVAGDDAAEFRINSAGADPAGATTICSVASWTNQYEWTKHASQASSAVSLTAGQMYYFEALHKEAGGGDNVAVAWTGPGLVSPTVISGDALASSDAVSLVKQPVAQSSSLGGTVSFSVSVEGDGPFLYEWFSNATSFGVSSSATLTLENIGAGHAGDYHCVVTYPDGTLTSSTVSLTITDAGILAGGGLWRDQFDGIGGGAITDLTSNSNYPRFPSSGGVMTDAEDVGGIADSFGARFTGWIRPDVTGTYYFYIASDDASELWLSTDDQPTNKVSLASVSGYSGARAWSSGGQSAGVNLVAGERYYIEVLHKEGGGGDHCAVAWRKPGEAVPANGSAPISGEYLEYFTGGVQGSTVTMPPYFSSSYDLSVAENVGSGISVGTVSAMDDGGHTPITYSIGGGNTGGMFAINASTGEITTAGDPDYESLASYTLLVNATNSVGAVGLTSVNITVQNRLDGTHSWAIGVNEGTPAVLKYTAGLAGNTTMTVDLSAISGDATYEFLVNGEEIGQSAVNLLSANGWSLRMEQWSNSGQMGITQSGVADWQLTAESGQSTASPYGAQTHLVFVVDSVAVETRAYVNSVLVGTLNRVPDFANVATTLGDASLRDDAESGILGFAAYNSALDVTEVTAHYDDWRGDVPNYAPVASDAVFAIDEQQAAGVVLGSVSATDSNAGDVLSYAITSGDPSGNFAIDAASGEITTAKALSYDLATQYSLSVTVTDINGLSDVATVTVNVNNLPGGVSDWVAQVDVGSAFVHKRTASVPGDSSVAVDLSVISGDATYEFIVDSVNFGQSYGNLLEANGWQLRNEQWDNSNELGATLSGNSDWSLTAESGQSVATPYDRVAHIVYVVDSVAGELRAYVDGVLVGRLNQQPNLTSAAAVLGSAQLRNDSEPGIISFAAYNSALDAAEISAHSDAWFGSVGNTAPVADDATFSLAEDIAVSSAVGTVSATDAGDTLSFAITAGNAGGEFAINSSTGEITTAGTFDYETTAQYVLTVTVTDSGSLTDTAAITVDITNVNEAIVANDNSGTLAEDVAIGSAVATVTTSDPDAGDSASFAITGGNTGNAFAIDANGNITTATALDFETTPSYSLTVTATDGGGLSDTATVTVTVTNVNEAIVANDNSGTLAESAAIGSAVATVTTSDPDAGDSVSFAITGGNTGNAFAIDANGNITTATALDFETTPSFSLTVTATDGGGLSDTATVTVTVNNVNEAVVANDASGSVAEDATTGTAVTTVSTSDPDAGDSVSFAITAGNTGNAFAIDTNGNITTAAALDFETTPSYSLTVTATDGGGLSDTATVTVTVTNVNEAIVANDSSGTLAEDAAIGSAVATVTTSDQDSGDSVSFAITGGNTGNAFVIDANGNITTATALNFEATASYSLIVTATDGGGLSDTATVTVTVTDADESALTGVQAWEDAIHNGSAFYYKRTASLAGNTTATVDILGSSGGITYEFFVNAEDLGQSEARLLDGNGWGFRFEQWSNSNNLGVTNYGVADYQFTAEAGQSVASPYGALTHLVFVVDSVNTQTRVFVDGVHVGTLAQVPNLASSNATLGFASLRDDADPGIVAFAAYNSALDASEIQAHQQAWFGAAQNQAPVANDASFGIAEDALVSSVVGTVSATDADTLSYAITAGNAGGEFAINSSTGEITTAAAFDFETASQYVLTVTVTDNGTPALSDTATITVNVTDVNEAPVANDTSGSLAEDATIGTAVATVSVNDVDAGDSHTFAITAGNTGNAFAIDNSGNISTVAGLDFETTASYTLTVEVSDSGSLTDTAAVTVTVTDVVETTAPVVAAGSASNIAMTTAELGYSITDDGGEAPTVTLYYGTTDGGTTPGNWASNVAVGAKATGAYVESLTGLTEGTSYYFTIAATNSVATTWGSTASFATTADASPKMVRTTVNAVSSTNWTTVDLGQNYTSAVIVATPIYADSTQVPVVTRIRNVSGSSFDLKLDRADGLTADVTCNVSVIAVEEGVYTLATDGVQMEAVKYTSTITAENNSWNAEARTYQNSYTTPVVVGQVMSANDANWSTFWSMGSSRLNPADASNLNVGKHVGEDPNATRANETIGYIVIESGNGTINGVAYTAAVGSDIVRNYENSASGYSYSLTGLSSASAAALSSTAMDGTDGAWPVLNGVDALSASTVKLIVDEDQLKDSEQKHATEQINYIIFE